MTKTAASTASCLTAPFGQDNYKTKPNSLVAHVELLLPTLEMALEHKQYQPILKDDLD